MNTELEYYGFSDFTDLRNKLIALEVLENAIKRNKFDKISLQKYFGLLNDQVEFLFSIFPELKVSQKPSQNKLSEISKHYKTEYKRVQAKLLQNMELWIFPRFRSLIGASCKGMFEGRPVYDIVDSLVMVLVPSIKDHILLLRMFSGEECIGIFGLGGYIAKFIPELAKEPTIFSLPIDGVVMDRNFYELALNSPKRLSIPRYADFVREHIIRIPLMQLAEHDFAVKLFASAIRNISEYLLEYLKILGYSPKTQTLDEVQILSAWRGAMNKMLITRNRFEMISDDALKGIPGILGYEGILEKLDELPLVKDVSIHANLKWVTWARFAIAGYDLVDSLIRIR